jgi:hypothetical protein
MDGEVALQAWCLGGKAAISSIGLAEEVATFVVVLAVSNAAGCNALDS